MHIKLHLTKDIVGGNRGTSTKMFEYLEKENLPHVGNPVEQEFFFSAEKDFVSMEKAIKDVDGNWRGLKTEDTKYFMLTINPSSNELKHLENDPRKLKEYTRIVMDEYAKGFNRKIDGRELSGKDLVYFAKIEKTRYYSERSDKHLKKDFMQNKQIQDNIQYVAHHSELSGNEITAEIERLSKLYKRDFAGTIIQEGNVKPGLNSHIHVVVARKDKSQKVSLSPFAKSRGSLNELNGNKVRVGFNRKEFQMTCESRFDQKFKYEREIEDSFKYKLARKKGEINYVHGLINLPRNERAIAKTIVLNFIDKDKQLQRMLNPIMNLPTSGEAMYSRAISSAVDKVAELLISGVSPTSAMLKSVVSRALSTALGSSLGI